VSGHLAKINKLDGFRITWKWYSNYTSLTAWLDSKVFCIRRIQNVKCGNCKFR